MDSLSFIRSCRKKKVCHVPEGFSLKVLQNSLFSACRGNNVIMVEVLLRHGVSLTAKNSRGRTATALAIREGSVEAAIFLLERDRMVINGSQTKCGSTALHLAAEKGSVQILQHIMKMCPSPNLDVQDFHGFTALMAAIRNRNFQSAKMLLQGGCNPNASNSFNGNTALHIACKIEDLEGVKLLLAFGARTSVRNRKDKFPADIAGQGIGRFIRGFPQKQKKARDAALTILIIKRFSKQENIWWIIPKDVVQLIAREVWRQRLQEEVSC